MVTIDANNLSEELSSKGEARTQERRVQMVFSPAHHIGVIRSADVFTIFRNDSNADALLLNLYQQLAKVCPDAQLLNNAEWIGSQIVTILSREVHRVKLDKPTKLPSGAACHANERIKDLLYDVGDSLLHREIPCSMPSAQHTIQLYLWIRTVQAELQWQPGMKPLNDALNHPTHLAAFDAESSRSVTAR